MKYCGVVTMQEQYATYLTALALTLSNANFTLNITKTGGGLYDVYIFGGNYTIQTSGAMTFQSFDFGPDFAALYFSGNKSLELILELWVDMTTSMCTSATAGAFGFVLRHVHGGLKR